MEPGNDHHLIIREEKGDRTFPLPEGKTHLGRARSNEVNLREKSVSRKHCLVERDGDRVIIFDNRTGNPTQIQRHGKQRTKNANGRILRDQDVLFVGRMEVVYRGCSGPKAVTSTQQSDIPPIIGAVPVEETQAPAPDPGAQQPPLQQPAAQQPPQPWPGQQPAQPYPGQPYPDPQGQQPPPAQPYPDPQGQQPPPAQPYPGQQQPIQQPYPAQQGQQPPPGQPYPGQQPYPDQQPPIQQPPQGYGPPGQQSVTFNPVPAPEPEKPKKKIKRRKRKLVAPKPKTSSATPLVTKKSSGNSGVNLAIGAGILVVLLIVVSMASKRMSNDNARLAKRQESAAEKELTKREAALQTRLSSTNLEIAKLQQMLAALEKTNQSRGVATGNEGSPTSPPTEEDTSPVDPGERITPAAGGGGKIDETRAAIAALIQQRNQLQNQYGGLRGGKDTSKIEASISRRTEVMGRNSNRILSVEDDEDTRKTAVAKIPQKVELSKKDYAALIERLKNTVGNYGLPIASPSDLEPDLTELVRATGKDGARGLVEVYGYSSELRAKMEKTSAFLKKRIDALMSNAYKINKDKGKYKSGGGGYYGSRHNHYLEQLQRLLELSEKKIEIKRSQKRRLDAFQETLGASFERLASIESYEHLTSVYSRSKDTDMRRKMVGAFSKGNTLQAVPALIKSLSSPDQELKGLVKSALASITGVKLGDNKKIWDAWWKENGEDKTN